MKDLFRVEAKKKVARTSVRKCVSCAPVFLNLSRITFSSNLMAIQPKQSAFPPWPRRAPASPSCPRQLGPASAAVPASAGSEVPTWLHAPRATCPAPPHTPADWEAARARAGGWDAALGTGTCKTAASPSECPHAPPRQPMATVAASASRALALNFPSSHWGDWYGKGSAATLRGRWWRVEGGGGGATVRGSRHPAPRCTQGRPLASPGGQFLAGCTS